VLYFSLLLPPNQQVTIARFPSFSMTMYAATFGLLWR
jgi:hypothetical protein